MYEVKQITDFTKGEAKWIASFLTKEGADIFIENYVKFKNEGREFECFNRSDFVVEKGDE